MSDYKLTKDRYIVVSLERTSSMDEACDEYDPETEPEFMHTACLFESNTDEAQSRADREYEGHVVRWDDDRVLSGISAYDAETLLKLMRQWL